MGTLMPTYLKHLEKMNILSTLIRFPSNFQIKLVSFFQLTISH